MFLEVCFLDKREKDSVTTFVIWESSAELYAVKDSISSIKDLSLSDIQHESGEGYWMHASVPSKRFENIFSEIKTILKEICPIDVNFEKRYWHPADFK